MENIHSYNTHTETQRHGEREETKRFIGFIGKWDVHNSLREKGESVENGEIYTTIILAQ